MVVRSIKGATTFGILVPGSGLDFFPQNSFFPHRWNYIYPKKLCFIACQK
jgi:hypothetical protein